MDTTDAQEFLRTALIKVLKVSNVKNETNKYFERYLDVVSENKKYKDNKGKSFYEFKAYGYMIEPAHIRTACPNYKMN